MFRSDLLKNKRVLITCGGTAFADALTDDQPLGGSAEDFDCFIRSEIQRWHPVVKRLGLKME